MEPLEISFEIKRLKCLNYARSAKRTLQMAETIYTRLPREPIDRPTLMSCLISFRCLRKSLDGTRSSRTVFLTSLAGSTFFFSFTRDHGYLPFSCTHSSPSSLAFLRKKYLSRGSLSLISRTTPIVHHPISQHSPRRSSCFHRGRIYSSFKSLLLTCNQLTFTGADSSGTAVRLRRTTRGMMTD